MSKLILDFDLSSQRRRTPNKAVIRPAAAKAKPTEPTGGGTREGFQEKQTKKGVKVGAETPEAQSSTQSSAQSSAQSSVRTWFLKVQENSKLVVAVLTFVFVFCSFWFLFLQTGTHSASASRDLLVHSLCATQTTHIVCHAESCNLKGACHATSKDVIFNSMECADAVRTITVHHPNGVVKQYPAYYLRIYNTTTFVIDGKRALFSPVLPSCHASTWPRKSNEIENAVSDKLHGSVVWVAPKKYKRYSLYRGEHLVATMEEDMVLVERVSGTHYVYQFELACRHWDQPEDSLVVFGEAENKRKEVKAFNYCY